MHNDSLDTLLLRHYGHLAPTPAGLEQRLISSVRTQDAANRQQQAAMTQLRNRRVSRRKIVRLVAFSSAGLGVLSAGMECLHGIEIALLGTDAQQQTAHSAL
jgi:hypothetical protein